MPIRPIRLIHVFQLVCSSSGLFFSVPDCIVGVCLCFAPVLSVGWLGPERLCFWPSGQTELVCLSTHQLSLLPVCSFPSLTQHFYLFKVFFFFFLTQPIGPFVCSAFHPSRPPHPTGVWSAWQEAENVLLFVVNLSLPTTVSGKPCFRFPIWLCTCFWMLLIFLNISLSNERKPLDEKNQMKRSH